MSFEKGIWDDNCRRRHLFPGRNDEYRDILQVYTTRRMNTSAAYRLLKKLRPSWWKGGIRESTLVLLVYAVYTLIQDALPDKEFLAFHNAYNVIDLETRMKIFWEPGIQSWFLGSDFLIQLVNALYTLLFFPVFIGFGIWAYKRHREQYSIARNAILISAVIGFPGFVFYPMAPPRLFPNLGFVDTLAKYQLINLNTSSLPASMVNQYAAMPSFHMAWTLLVGIATVRMAKAWWLKLAGILLPLLMLVTIIATANHFIMDAVAGSVVAGLSYGLALLFAKLSIKKPLSQKSVAEAS
jgi:membrane-associated phospholipid phosphatase